jgi:hypothetical protein
MELAGEPEMRDMLKIALAAVLDSAPPFRLQLGRGSVRPADPPPAHEHHPADVADIPHIPAEDYDEGPEPEYSEIDPSAAEPSAPAVAGYESAVPATAGREPLAPAPAGREPQSAVERLLVGELGGQIVAEHVADPAETPDAEDLSALGDEIEAEDPDQGDPGLFDNDGED